MNSIRSRGQARISREVPGLFRASGAAAGAQATGSGPIEVERCQYARVVEVKKILVVEDQEDVREIVRMTLELEGYEIQDADRGASGLALAAQWRPDLVLTDVMMPGGIDGFQVCERIKSDPALKRTKVVILTARNQAQDRKAGQKAGADEFLTKPFSPIELSAIVTRLLR